MESSSSKKISLIWCIVLLIHSPFFLIFGVFSYPRFSWDIHALPMTFLIVFILVSVISRRILFFRFVYSLGVIALSYLMSELPIDRQVILIFVVGLQFLSMYFLITSHRRIEWASAAILTLFFSMALVPKFVASSLGLYILLFLPIDEVDTVAEKLQLVFYPYHWFDLINWAPMLLTGLILGYVSNRRFHQF